MRRLLAERSPAEIAALRPDVPGATIDVPEILASDLDHALGRTKPACSAQSLIRFAEWNAKFGSHHTE